ncbi:MAG: aromatic ring-hydroxylating oxygenase subunit alpha [Gammaproteobacteria bacterium]
MEQQQQIELMSRMIKMIDTSTTEDAGRLVRNPTSSYVCKDLAEKEWQNFFQNHPQVLGISSDLPEPGSFMTNNDLGIPILATRDSDGRFRAFVNACRHRGAVLTEEERGNKSRFSCPFHAWTFSNDGKLLGIREAKNFGEIDKDCHGLIELSGEEKYGLLVVHPQVNGTIDIDELLGSKLASEFDNWNFGDTVHLGNTSLERNLNWKIANDTFGENYHFDALHGTRLNNLFYGDATAYDEYGRNHRLTLPSRYIDVLRDKPHNQWNVTDAGVVVYYVFPNTQIVLANRIISIFRIYPDRDEVGRSKTQISFYSAPHIGAEIAEDSSAKLDGKNVYDADVSQRLEFNLETQIEIIKSTLDEEDYYMGEKSQQAAASGKVEYFVFGRNEPALHHFHQNFREALKQPPLESVA